MNHFAIGTQRIGTRYIGWFRKVHRAGNCTVNKNGKPMLFDTKLEAKSAATDAFLDYLNSPMVRDGVMIEGTRITAESLFNFKSSNHEVTP